MATGDRTCISICGENKVLIAEDEFPIARAILRMVEQVYPAYKVIGYEINGMDALEHMRWELADLVFTDIRMPMMDGLKFLEAVKMEWPDCMVVILSGHQDFTYTQAALRFGAFDYLLKPFFNVILGEDWRWGAETERKRIQNIEMGNQYFILPHQLTASMGMESLFYNKL